MAREAQRHDAQRGDERAGLHEVERTHELIAVVLVGAQHDLGVDLNSAFENLLEGVEAALGVLAHEAGAHVGAHCVQRHVERRQGVRDDTLDVVIGEVRERDEVALEKGQAVVVVAHVECAAHAAGKHLHEAEEAVVAAQTHAVEHRPVKGDAPVPAPVALDVALELELVGRVGVGDALKVDLGAVGLPVPVDHIAQLHAVHVRHDHAGLETLQGGGAAGLDLEHRGAAPAGAPTGTRRLTLNQLACLLVRDVRVSHAKSPRGAPPRLPPGRPG